MLLTLSLLTVSEKSIDLTLSIDRYSLLSIFVIECGNSLLYFEVSNVELFFTFSLSISNPGNSFIRRNFQNWSINKILYNPISGFIFTVMLFRIVFAFVAVLFAFMLLLFAWSGLTVFRYCSNIYA